MKRTLKVAIAIGVIAAVLAAGTASSVTLNLGNGLVVNVPTGKLVCLPGGGSINSLGIINLNDPQCPPPPAPPKPPPGKPGGATGGTPTTTTPATQPTGPAKPGTGGVRGPRGPGKAHQINPSKIRNRNGTPTVTNPTLSVGTLGPAPIGVPNFIINQYEIPPFLLPIYQACGSQYQIPWQVLAAINKIETNFGTNLSTSSAGALGWMQFLPSTWQQYGVDANGDGVKDPYNPVDAICAAANYLKAAGGSTNIRQAIFSYNHASWYVDEVLLNANQYGKLPDALVGSLTGLTQGAHFPVAANSRYADDLSDRAALHNATTRQTIPHNAANVIRSSPTRRGINIYSSVNAPVVAVNDGTIQKIGQSKRLGKYVVLQDVYGNTYTYAQLGSIAPAYAAPKPHPLNANDFKLVQPLSAPKPSGAASAGTKPVQTKSYGNVRAQALANNSESRGGGKTTASAPKPSGGGAIDSQALRARIDALTTPGHGGGGGSGLLDGLLSNQVPGISTFKDYFGNALKFDPKTMVLKPLRVGSKVTGGTLLGRIGPSKPVAPHINFAIRPVGTGAPTIDPKPILDGWKLLETTAIYRAAGQNPLVGANPTVGQVLLMSTPELQNRVLSDPSLSIYACGRQDIQTGQINRRVLAVMEYLVARGYRLTITSLKCGHSLLTTSGNSSAHASGDAVDIAAVNAIPIEGHQGPGTITEAVIKDLLTLQGAMRPDQVISLMALGGPSFALPDHYNHIHVGYAPEAGTPGVGGTGSQLVQVLNPQQWTKLIGRLGQIKNPKVPAKPSQYAIPVTPQTQQSKSSGALPGD